MKNYSVSFAAALQRFFTEYLINERGVSHNTIRAYRDVFLLLIDYFKLEKSVSPDKIELTMINRANILEFLDWLETERHVKVSTRNQRLAAISSFVRFLQTIEPIHLGIWKEVLDIRLKKQETGRLIYMSIDEIKQILEQVDTTTARGRRDLCLLSLLYNTGARAQEILDLRCSDICFTKPYYITLTGKGAKTRIVPLDEPIINLLAKYIKEYKLDRPENIGSPLFFNSRKERLTTQGLTYKVQKYADLARDKSSTFMKAKITPHIFRHSRAMHLLQAGVNLIYIRDILGHVSIQTTQIYARADSKHVRSALEEAYENIGIVQPSVKQWETDPDLREKLKSFC